MLKNVYSQLFAVKEQFHLFAAKGVFPYFCFKKDELPLLPQKVHYYILLQRCVTTFLLQKVHSQHLFQKVPIFLVQMVHCHLWMSKDTFPIFCCRGCIPSHLLQKVCSHLFPAKGTFPPFSCKDAFLTFAARGMLSAFCCKRSFPHLLLAKRSFPPKWVCSKL